MIRSMTGYGDAVKETPHGRLRAEIRTVNHRFFSANLKIARAAERYEPQIRGRLKAQLARGHVNLSLRLSSDAVSDGALSLTVDQARARAYHRALSELKDSLGLAGELDLGLLARYGDIFVSDDGLDQLELDQDDVLGVVTEAARATVQMREQEGARLAVDLAERLAAIESGATAVEERAPQRLVAERDRLRAAVAELLENVAVDEDRVAREVAFLAERWDVSEELVRIRAHIALFRDLLADDSGDPVGKRLGFLVQELNREVNTIGSKANDAPIEHLVVSMKDEIERLREQVENIE